MNPTPRRRGAARLALVSLAGCLAVTSCSKNPIDAALEVALDFSGIFAASDGMEIELSGTDAYVKKLGTTQFPIAVKVGDKYMMFMNPTSEPTTWSGYARSRTGFLDLANVKIDGSRLIITRPNSESPTGQGSFSKIGESTGGTPGTGGTTPTGSTCEAQWGAVIRGGWKATSAFVTGRGEEIGSGPNNYGVTFDFGATSYREYWRRNNGSGSTLDYVGTYKLQTDAGAALIGNNRCSIVSTWMFNDSSTGTTTHRIVSYSGGVLEMTEPNLRFKIVKR